MKPRLFNLAAAVSLALCVATLALWATSYHLLNTFHVPFTRTFSVASIRGEAELIWEHPVLSRMPIHHLPPYTQHTFFIGIFWSEWLDPSYAAQSGYPVGTTIRWGCDLHDWFLTIVFALLPTSRLIVYAFRTRRHVSGLCPTCGYDLRATPEKSGPLFDRCPECGAGREMQKSQC